jgi:hypothetical protein
MIENLEERFPPEITGRKFAFFGASQAPNPSFAREFDITLSVSLHPMRPDTGKSEAGKSWQKGRRTQPAGREIEFDLLQMLAKASARGTELN